MRLYKEIIIVVLCGLVIVSAFGYFIYNNKQVYEKPIYITKHKPPSPSDVINIEEIYTYDNHTIIQHNGIYKTTVAGSGSMLPLININTTILEIEVNNETSLNVGDIIIYDDGEDYIIHRLIWINDTHFIARGDNNDVDDDVFPREAIKLKAIGIIY